MSIRYKIFGAFILVIALACGLAFYGMRGISSSGDLVVQLYDGPLMGINHARSAHAALNEARLIMQREPQRGHLERGGRSSSKSWSATFPKISMSCVTAFAAPMSARRARRSRASCATGPVPA